MREFLIFRKKHHLLFIKVNIFFFLKMPTCSAFGCSNKPTKKIPGITFHRFPKKSHIREAWTKACRRENWEPSSRSLLCSEHFSEDQINRTLRKVILCDDAVPNIFKGFPSYLQKNPKKRKSPVKRCTPPASTSKCTQVLTSLPCSDKDDECEGNFSKVDASTSPIRDFKLHASNLLGWDPTAVMHGVSTLWDPTAVVHGHSTSEVIGADDKIVPVEPEVIVKVEKDETFEETGVKLEAMNDSDKPCCVLKDYSSLNSEEILKQKLEDMTALYEKTLKKLKLCQEQCKRYVKQVLTLEEVIDNLKQINSFSDFN